MNRKLILLNIKDLINECNYEKLLSYCHELDFSFRYYLTGLLFREWQISGKHKLLEIFDRYCFLNMDYSWHYDFLFLHIYSSSIKNDTEREDYLDAVLCYAVAPYYNSFLPYFDFEWVYKELKSMNSTRSRVSEYERLHLNSNEEKVIRHQISIPDVASRIDGLIRAKDYSGLESFVYTLPDDYFVLCLFWIYKHFIQDHTPPLGRLLCKFSALYPDKEYKSEFNLFRIQLLIEILEFNQSDYKTIESLLQIYLEDQEKYKDFVTIEEFVEKLKIENPQSETLLSFIN